MVFAVIGLVILSVIFFLIYMKLPVKHRITNIDELARLLGDFMTQCSDGSVLFLTHKKTGWFLQFALHLEKNAEVNLHFGFPDAPWSRNLFDDLVNEFSMGKIQYGIRSTQEEKVRRFLTVDRIKNVEDGVRIVKLALKAIGLFEQDVYLVQVKGWLRSDLTKRKRRGY